MSSSPTCRPCASLAAPAGRECEFDVTECAQVPTGGSCKVRCRAPYEGNDTTATCPSGNSNPAQQLLYGLPECKCPDPAAEQGYSKAVHGSSRRRLAEGSAGPSPGDWECAEGYAGNPVVRCESGGCAGGENIVTSRLEGCKPLVPCAAPVVDTCQFDVSACSSVQPGTQCEVRCKPPFVGQSTLTSCPEGNTDPDQELANYSLTCTLEDCPDPQPWPEGYNKTPAGTWTCASGFNGTVLKSCLPGTTWAQDCGAVSMLEGCQPIVPCDIEEVTGLDFCMYDTSGCRNVPPGADCEVHCKAPFQGASTRGNSCPHGNTNPRGLNWARPECALLECEDPTVVPAGYIWTSTNWLCTQSYSGFAQKVCEATEACEVVPRLTGCAQLRPCLAPLADCRFYTYDCASVQPGATCQLSCQAPFTGNTTIASCLSGNTNPNGLVVDYWPKCETSTCADPWPWPSGYTKTSSGWRCATGFAGTVTKTCVWREEQCTADAVLSGCTLEEPCVPLMLREHDDACKFNTSQCSSILAGSTCSVACTLPYEGTPGQAICPAGNIDPTRHPELSPPSCDCADPFPMPLGYNKTEDGWKCATGFAGRAVKVCRPGDDCQPQPDLTGCSVPVACEVTSFQGDVSPQDTLSGVLRFGPAMLEDSIHEEEVKEYRVYFGDRCDAPVGPVILTVDKTEEHKPCCRSDTYEARITSQALEAGATGLLVVVRTLEGDAPAGRFVSVDFSALRVQRAPVNLALHAVLDAAVVALVCLGVTLDRE